MASAWQIDWAARAGFAFTLGEWHHAGDEFGIESGDGDGAMFGFRVDDEVTLVLLEERHADEVFRVIDASREHLRQWLTWVDGTKSAGDVAAFIRASLAQFAGGKGVQAGIRFRGRLVGIIGHRKLDFKHQKNELGFWLGAEFTGQGIATRALRGMLAYAFDELHLHRSTLRIPTEHARALKLATRVGFMHEGVIRKTNWLNGRWVDHALFGMLDEEWRRHEGHGDREASV